MSGMPAAQRRSDSTRQVAVHSTAEVSLPGARQRLFCRLGTSEVGKEQARAASVGIPREPIPHGDTIMKRTLIATAILAALASPSLPQTGPSAGGAGDNDSGGAGGLGDRGGTPGGWSASIGNTFFSGAHHTKLRSHSAITCNWAKLSAHQQEQVRSDGRGMA